MNVFFLLLFLKLTSSIIVLPFALTGVRNFDRTSDYDDETPEIKYTIEEFFYDYIIRDIFTTINIGTPPQKTTTIISPFDHFFKLDNSTCKKKSLDTIENYSIVSKKRYEILKSTSAKNISNTNNYIDDNENGEIINENFSFYNTTYLKFQPMSLDYEDPSVPTDTTISLNTNIIIEEYTYDKICASVGMGLPYKNIFPDLPNLIIDLKKANIIQDYCWTFKYLDSNEGQMIIGDLPHNYEKSKLKYNISNYFLILSDSPGDYSFPWSIRFNSIFSVNANNTNTTELEKIIRCTLLPNLGFFIGNSKYKEYLMENYFGNLIQNNICSVEKTKTTEYSRSNGYAFGTNGSYEIFVCNATEFSNSKIDYRKSFPSLHFKFKEFDFYFHGYDLFKEINKKYYFFVVFPEKNEIYEYQPIYLGIPFYQKYQLVFNYDSKSIGFYNGLEYNGGNENNKKTKNGSFFGKLYVRIILEIIGIIILVIIGYLIGKKVNQVRKKRANELKDENYDYFPENGENNLINN